MQHFQSLGPWLRRRIAPSSLQWRLSIEWMAVSVVGIGSVAGLASWQLEQTLVSTHKQTLTYLATRFPEQVEMYRKDGTVESGIEQTIHNFSSPGLLIWVKNSDGEIISRSTGMNIPPLDLIAATDQIQVPTQPTPVHLDNHHVVLCGNPLTLNNDMLGNVFFLKDITEEQQRLDTGLHSLLGVSALAILVLMLTIPLRIRRALHPLMAMSQVASAVSADDLSRARLHLPEVPDEIKGLAQTFNQMLERLSASWEQQREFVGNVSHELRTPLTVIAGYLQSLMRRPEAFSPYQQQAITTAATEAERTIRMLEDLLDLARADSGNLVFRQHPIILNTLLPEVVAMSQKVSQRQLNLTLSAESIVACGDQDRLQQSLINLIDNAIKYSEPPHPIDISVDVKEQQVWIHVRDQGIGIPLAYQQRIFERFYRVDESMTRSRDGTGLGLAIAKSLIEGMGGRISVRSKPGEGSLFSIALPLWS
ncbi:MAG: HAMP domain-containing sensor histidine kinase [Synechococcales cyanobacterium]